MGLTGRLLSDGNLCSRGITGPDIRDRTVQAAKQEIVYCPTVAKTHLVLGGMHIDIDASWIQFKEQNKCRMPTVEQYVTLSLANGMGNQLVPDDTAIHKKILLISLTSGKGWLGDPTP